MFRFISLIGLSAVCVTIASLAGSCSEERETKPATAKAVRQALYEDEGVAFCERFGVGWNLIEGTPGDDVLEGTPFQDCILGYGGNDVIVGGGGPDLLHGGDGDDVLSVEDGEGSILVGGRGNDMLYAEGTFGEVKLYGGPGDDRLEGTAEILEAWGEEGQDEIVGSANALRNTILGGPGDDRIIGGYNEDWLFGDGELTTGGDGADFIDGLGGGDWITGGGCHDVIVNAGLFDTADGQDGLDACSDPSFCVNSEVSAALGCTSDAECASDERCVAANGLCVPDTEPVCEQRENDDSDAGVDGGLDGGMDGGLDAGDGDAALDADLCEPTGNTDTSCDGLDDDCDGVSDEDFVSSATSCGVGACARTGATSCVKIGPITQLRDSCEPGDPASSDATCDGIDDDCDGVADEDFVSSATSCGIGACASTGVTSCFKVGPFTQLRDSCVPGAGASADTTCDGLDDDCDGLFDEDFVSSATSCQVAGCEATGQLTCAAGQAVDTCFTDPVCIGELDCTDGVDNDNDGDTDCFDLDCGCSAVEICGNSLDDDLDGLADCADPDCDGDVVCMDLPPDPVTIAPPVVVPSGNGATYDAVSFLFEGGDPVQRGVASDTIQAPRAHVLRGVVTDVAGSALPAIRVEVNEHPEYGHTLTRADGAYDLVVNGGDRVTLNFSAPSFLPVQRSVMASWDDATTLDDVAMTTLDPEVTTVDFTGASGAMQVAVGSTVQDGDGERTATVMFPAGTEATMTLSDGSTMPLTSAHVRATEFTVGEHGLEAMPAEPAANTAYTYAVELSVDEALQAGATTVSFSQPVPFYVDNFLGFPVGGAVPTGYYDREQGQWIPIPDGRVIEVVGVDGTGQAQVDVTGDGAADGFAEVLEPLGFTTAELVALAQQHGVGTSLWRVLLEHFTPVDCNWPYLPASDAPAPPDSPGPPGPPPFPPDPQGSSDPEVQAEQEEDCEDFPHSTIHCMAQSLGESVPIAGTNLSMTYHSRRAPEARKKSFVVQLTEESIHPDLYSVDLQVDIAGKSEVLKFGIEPNQSHRYTWDGLDAYGRVVRGQRIQANVQLCYWYVSRYVAVEARADRLRSFGTSLTGVRAAVESGGGGSGGGFTLVGSPRFVTPPLASVCRSFAKTVSGASPMPLWEISDVRMLDPASEVVLEPSGRLSSPSQYLLPLYREHTARNFYVAPEGAFLKIENASFPTRGRLMQLRNGSWSEVAGQEASLLVVQGSSSTPLPLAFYDGWIYVIEQVPGQTLPVALVKYRFSSETGLSDRTVVVPGTGSLDISNLAGATSADGVRFRLPNALRVDPRDGSILFSWAQAIYRITQDGMLDKVLTHQTFDDQQIDGSSLGFDVGGDGSMYRAERRRTLNADGSTWGAQADAIVAYGPDGRRDVLFSWPLSSCPSALGASSQCGLPSDVVLDERTGRVFFTTQVNWANYALLSVPAGGGEASVIARDLSAILAEGSSFQTTPIPYLVKGSEGSVYVADRYFTFSANGATTIWRTGLSASSDGLSYTYRPDGQPIEAREPTTGALVSRFEYTGDKLTAIVDGSDQRVAIGRDPGTGMVSYVDSPYGQRTQYDYDAAGRLWRITDPDNVASVITYHGNTQLLATFTNRNSVVSSYDYDARGRLVAVNDAEGSLTLEAKDAFGVVKRDADGRVTQYTTHTAADGKRTRYVRFPDGTLNSEVMEVDGTQTLTRSDGAVVVRSTQRDPRNPGMAMPAEQTITLPGGLVSRTTTSRAVAQDGTVSTVHSINGQAWADTYVPATRTWTWVSPEGRTSTAILDSAGRPVQINRPGRTSLQLSYDADGRLQQVVSGTSVVRSTTITYSTEPSFFGRAERIASTDASDLTFDERDLMGRVLAQSVDTSAGSVTMGFGWDNLGNLTQLITPRSNAHDMTYDGRNALMTYTPAQLGDASRPGALAINYTAMGALSSMTLANGSAFTLTRDPARGRVETAVVDAVTYSYAYHPETGQLTSTTGSDGTTVTTAYDGPLVTARTWGGSSSPVSGSVSFGYNADLNLSSLSVGGVQEASFGYDGDQLLTSAGALSVVRDPATGDIDTTTLDAITTTTSLDEHGAVQAFESFAMGSPVYSYAVTARDGQGRILDLVETFGSVSHTKGYRYDELGRLWQVLDDGVVSATYTYDDNGNRLPGTYDEQDRIQAFGGCSYTMDAAGFLSQRDCGGGPETFVYDARGSLRQVTLANGDVIDYVVDPEGRRIGRKVNGVFDKGWLYLDGMRPVAQVDSSGQLEAVYVYGTRANVPDYIVDKSGGSDAIYRVLADHLGTPRRVVRASDGQIVHELDLDEWGSVVREAGPRQDLHPFGLAGGLRDRDTGLVRFGARDYDADAGRWTARDPIRFSGGDTNLYAYVGNDPINFIDPWGLLKLPAGPSGLGEDWVLDPTHKDPNGQRFRHPSGDVLDFHKGRPGKQGWRGKDHWHHNGGKDHLLPGDEIPDPESICEDQNYSPGGSDESGNNRTSVPEGWIDGYGAPGDPTYPILPLPGPGGIPLGPVNIPIRIPIPAW